MIKNDMFLYYRNKIFISKGDSTPDKRFIVTFLKNIESIGYCFSMSLIERLITKSNNEIVELYQSIFPILKEVIGEHKIHKPMYPNFPKQLMEMDSYEIYLNSMIHYIGVFFGENILPYYKKKDRFPLIDNFDLKLIDLGTEKEYNQIFLNLMGSKTSISETDKIYLEDYIINNPSIKLPDKIPYKEILSFISKIIIENTDLGMEGIKNYYKTPTDVLRLATALSYGDTSLATNTRFISFKRKIRRSLISLLENIAEQNHYFIEDLVRHRGKWVKLAHGLHISEYKNKYPKTHEAITLIRSKDPIYTTNTLMEEMLIKKDINSLVDLLKDRGGVFARKLDHILRISKKSDHNLVLETFKNVTNKISTPVLLQLISHFQLRNNNQKYRIFYPKGNLAKVYVIKNQLSKIPQTSCDKVVSICRKCLILRFSALDEMGRVYIDKTLKNYNIPFSQRSAQKSLKTIVRGSRIPIPDKNILRLFTWWTNAKNQRSDIDLSATFLDKDYKYVDHISYTNLRNTSLNVCHSGDITDAPKGASEFIDIDIKKAIKNNIKYVVMSLQQYTEQSFSNTECFAGWMVRDDSQKGEIYEPKSVQNKFDITADTKFCIPLIFNLEKKEMIWGDLSLKNNLSHVNNIEYNLSSIALLAISLDQLIKPNLYELFSLHIKARKGIIVNNKINADIVFDTENTPFNLDIISSQYL